jgi:hypothetical protein
VNSYACIAASSGFFNSVSDLKEKVLDTPERAEYIGALFSVSQRKRRRAHSLKLPRLAAFLLAGCETAFTPGGFNEYSASSYRRHFCRSVQLISGQCARAYYRYCSGESATDGYPGSKGYASAGSRPRGSAC